MTDKDIKAQLSPAGQDQKGAADHKKDQPIQKIGQKNRRGMMQAAMPQAEQIIEQTISNAEQE